MYVCVCVCVCSVVPFSSSQRDELKGLPNRECILKGLTCPSED